MSIASDIQQLKHTAIIEMYELDLSPLGDADVYRFYAGVNLNGQPLVWRGDTYAAFPVVVSGFDMSTNGQLPRPKLQVSNVNGTITALVLAYNDLVGAQLVRHRTLAKYLDAVNFPGGVNPTADPDAAFADDIFFIDRKSMETDEAVEFELATALDVSGVTLPRRLVIQNVCPWQYRSAECGYTGPPRADIRDQELTVSVAQTAQEIAYFTARSNWYAARGTRIAAQQDLAIKQNTLAVANESVQLQEAYDTVYPGQSCVIEYSNGSSIAWWNDTKVTLGTTYRKGALQLDEPQAGRKYYKIQRWGVNTVAQSAAQSAYNTAKSTLTTAQGNEATALSAYNAAIGALPEGGALYVADQCGKRLASCRLRFQQPDQSGVLPYGGFPAVGLVS